MRFGETKWEFKLGAFVFFGIVILAIFILLIGNFRLWTKGYRVNFLFNFVNGLKEGAPIRFAGVDIGEVRKIEFIFIPQENNTKLKVIGWVKKEVRIPQDSTVWVNTLGLLGEKYLEIIPGNDYVNFLAKDGVIVGNDPVAMHEIGILAKDIANKINVLITKIKEKEGTVGKLLYDDGLYNRLEIIAKELEEFIRDIKNNPWKLFWRKKEKK